MVPRKVGQIRSSSGMARTDAVIVLTTVSTADDASALIRELLERRLIACGTLIPGGHSLFRWQGKVADESEVVVLLKTRSARIKELEEAFSELHPYTLPELLALPAARGLPRYLNWIADETS